MGVPEGKTRVRARFGIKPNPIHKTFVVELEAMLTKNRVLELNIEAKGIEQVCSMIKEYREKGWTPVEEWEEKEAKHYR
ncbi:MAG: hypothetical protein ACTSPB_01460 [Candidatus Thorarchaeota archaeon]